MAKRSSSSKSTLLGALLEQGSGGPVFKESTSLPLGDARGLHVLWSCYSTSQLLSWLPALFIPPRLV